MGWGAGLGRAVCGVGSGYLIDNALDDENLDVDVAGHVGKELGDEVVNGGGGEGGGVTFGAGGGAGLAAGAQTAHEEHRFRRS